MPRIVLRYLDKEAREWLISCSVTELVLVGLALGVGIVSLWQVFHG